MPYVQSKLIAQVAKITNKVTGNIWNIIKPLLLRLTARKQLYMADLTAPIPFSFSYLSCLIRRYNSHPLFMEEQQSSVCVNILDIFFSELIGRNIGQQIKCRKIGTGTQAVAVAD